MSTNRFLMSALICSLLIGCGEQQSDSAVAASVTEQPMTDSGKATYISSDSEIILTIEKVPEGTHTYFYETTAADKPVQAGTLPLDTSGNGEYRFSGQAINGRTVTVVLVQAEEKKPLSRFDFTHEPEITQVHYKADNTRRVKDRPYNQLAVRSTVSRPQYLAAQQKYRESVEFLYREYKRMGKTQEEFLQKARALRNPFIEMRKSYLEGLHKNHPNPVSSQGACQKPPSAGAGKRMKYPAETGKDLVDHRRLKKPLCGNQNIRPSVRQQYPNRRRNSGLQRQ